MSKSLSINVKGNLKQLDAIKAWSDKDTIDIVFGGSKGCLIGSQLVRTITGLKEIKNIEIGEQVLTFNEVTKGSEYKKVLKTPKYPTGGDNHYHKMITFVMQNGEEFCLTPNHEIYDNGNWIATGEYAKRVLEGSRWNRWSISNLNNGESSIKKDLWEEEPFHFKALFDKERIFENLFQSKRKKTNADTPISCFSFFRQFVSSVKFS